MKTENSKQKSLQKLTKQDISFVEKVVETGKLTRSAQEAYGLENQRYATQKAQRLIAKDSIIEAIEVKRKTLKQALIDKGITETKIADRINVLLDATIGENDKPDVNAIDKGLKHAKEIYGVEDSEQTKQGGNTYNFIFSPEVQTEVKAIDSRIKEMLTKKHVQET